MTTRAGVRGCEGGRPPPGLKTKITSIAGQVGVVGVWPDAVVTPASNCSCSCTCCDLAPELAHSKPELQGAGRVCWWT